MYMVTSKPKRMSLYSGVDHFIDVSSRLIDETVINFFVYNICIARANFIQGAWAT